MNDNLQKEQSILSKSSDNNFNGLNFFDEKHSDFETSLSIDDDERFYDTPNDDGNVHPCSSNADECGDDFATSMGNTSFSKGNVLVNSDFLAQGNLLENISQAANHVNTPLPENATLNHTKSDDDHLLVNVSNYQRLVGSCYRISNFGVGENGGKFPLLNHRYKMKFFKNTSVTSVASFDNNTRGFKFDPFSNFTARTFGETKVVGQYKNFDTGG
nr:replication protein A 70 kDa DNA-binding subunit B [Tanacetum cinerariifolium]